ncbi:MAG: Zn-dependent hydrolase, partial [Gemmatimonadales bacterium]
LEEAKADVLGLYMITKLIEGGEAGDIRNNYVTFLASIFRSIRFGAGDAHGRANAAEFGFLMRQGAFDRDPATGRYRVNFEKMGSAVDALSAAILKLQGDGDYEGTRAFLAEMGTLDDTLKSDLARLARAGIPVDVVFEQ